MRGLIILLLLILLVYAWDRVEDMIGWKKLNSTIEDSKEAINYINELRVKEGRRPIVWDKRAYEFAIYRAKDMVTKQYFDHISPSGESILNQSLRERFGFKWYEALCENIYMEPGWDFDPINPTFRDYYHNIEKVAIDCWMDSPGHRANMMNPKLEGGAVACYKACCVFIGYYKAR